MKKIILVLVTLLCLFGCTANNTVPSETKIIYNCRFTQIILKKDYLQTVPLIVLTQNFKKRLEFPNRELYCMRYIIKTIRKHSLFLLKPQIKYVIIC